VSAASWNFSVIVSQVIDLKGDRKTLARDLHTFADVLADKRWTIPPIP
jgi:hypothetical protein